MAACQVRAERCPVSAHKSFKKKNRNRPQQAMPKAVKPGKDAGLNIS
jgi:hypothetical protein